MTRPSPNTAAARYFVSEADEGDGFDVVMVVDGHRSVCDFAKSRDAAERKADRLRKKELGGYQ